nr:MAG TPA: SecD/SecF GG Motif [Caudoviricetes sp.]
MLIGKNIQKTFKNINYSIDTRGGFDMIMTR